MDAGLGEVRRQLGVSKELGFLGPGPIDAHVQHASAYADVLRALPFADASPRCVDLGSGGGLPGLVLLALLPDWDFTLLDSNERRTAFLVGAVEALGHAHRCVVVCGRAELVARDAVHRESYTAVVCRSFGPPAVTVECAAPFLHLGGVLVVSDPPDGSNERWPSEGLRAVGLASRSSPSATDAPRLFCATKVTPSTDAYPRRSGVPTKRPLF